MTEAKGPGAVLPPMATLIRPGVKPATARVEAPRLGAGPGVLERFPQLDIKVLTAVGFEATTQTLELRDRKNVAMRISRSKSGEYQLQVGPRGKEAAQVSLSQQMAQDLSQGALDAVVRAGAKPEHVDFMRQLGKAASLSLREPSGSVLAPGTTTAPVKAKDVLGRAPQAAWGQFASARTDTVPATVGAQAAGLQSTLAGLDVQSLQLRDFRAAQGFTELVDGQNNVVSITQGKFSPPPQFTLEYVPSDGETRRMPVGAALARELASSIREALARSPFAEDLTAHKAVNVLCQNLHKVI